MAFIYFGGAHPGNTSFGAPPLPGTQPMPAATKRVQVGTLGVIAADLALDPSLDLVDDPVTLPKGTEPDAYVPPDEDYADLIYIAGGHLGLWAMEAHPVDEYQNRAVRIDNSRDLDPTTQDSNRFCTDAEVVEIEGQHFLVAVFARRDDNVLRIYALDDVHAAMAAARSASGPHPDLGHEIIGEATSAFGAHPDRGPDVLVNGSSVTMAGSYGMNLAVDPDPPEGDGVGDTMLGDPIDVYVAALSGGLVRFRIYRTGTPSSPGITGFTTYGPVFGTDVQSPPAPDTAYDDSTGSLNGVAVNSSDLPADWFRNMESRVFGRTPRFQELIRSDPPYFMDVELQNDSEGHFLYCAMGHLGWLRFDLDAQTFRHGMEIDHLECRPAVERDGGGVPVVGSEDISLKWPRKVELDPTVGIPFSPFTEPFDLDGNPDTRNALHAYQVALTRTGAGSSARNVLVVNYNRQPWTKEPRIKGPGRVLDQTFQIMGGWDLDYLPLMHSGQASTLVVYADLPVAGANQRPFRYDSGLVVTRDSAGVDLSNYTQATQVGGESLYVPREQPENGASNGERIRVLHTHTVKDNFDVPPPFGSRFDDGNVCVSFIDTPLGVPVGVSNYPAFVRDRDDITGRYNFGAAFARAGDGNVVLQATNDFKIAENAPVVADGLESPAGTLQPLAPPLTPVVIPGSDAKDRRLATGIQSDEFCQFVVDIAGQQEQWAIGDRSIPGGVGTYYYFGRHSFQSQTSGPPVIEKLGEWLLGRADNRFGTDNHGYYTSVTSHPDFDAFTRGAVGGVGSETGDPAPTDPVPETFVTAVRTGPDGVLVFGRDTMVEDYLVNQWAPSLLDFRSFRDDPWDRWSVPFPQPPQGNRSRDWSFTLNSHPEWNNLEFPNQMPPSSSDLALAQQLWFADPKPALIKTVAQFQNRVPSTVITPIRECAATFTFLPKMAQLKLSASASDRVFVLGAPCGYASCPPDLSVQLGSTLAIDPGDPFPAPGQSMSTSDWLSYYHYLPIPASYDATAPWDAQYRKGFVSLWQFSGAAAFPESDAQGNPLGVDPWSRARRATEPTGPLGGHVSERPAGSPDLDPLFLDGEGSSAFQLLFADLVDGQGVERTFAFVADFAGTVQAFDVTDLLQISLGPRSPVDVWTAPPDPLELLRPNVFDVAVDKLSDPAKLNVYVACSRAGVQVVEFDADTWFGATQALATPGSPHSVTVRRSPEGSLLLVNDLSGGYRFYRRP